MNSKAKELAIHDKDTGSSEIQIALLTEKIETLSKHIKQFKKDKHSSVGLLRAVNRRKKLLEYLKKNKMDSYKNVLTKLNLRKQIEGNGKQMFKVYKKEIEVVGKKIIKKYIQKILNAKDKSLKNAKKIENLIKQTNKQEKKA